MPVWTNQDATSTIAPNRIEHISYIESHGNYIKIYFANSDYQLIRSSLKSINTELPSHFFCRIHNRYIVNLSKVTAIATRSSIIQLNLQHIDKTLTVSRSFEASFNKAFRRFSFNDVPFTKNDPGYCF